jgi:hypothetical protein
MSRNKQEEKINSEINKYLAQEKKRLDSEVKLLLLGKILFKPLYRNIVHNATNFLVFGSKIDVYT